LHDVYNRYTGREMQAERVAYRATARYWSLRSQLKTGSEKIWGFYDGMKAVLVW
jgi:hypothetical protein